MSLPERVRSQAGEHPNPNLVAISLGYVQQWLEGRELDKALACTKEVVAQSAPRLQAQRELEKAVAKMADAGVISADGPAG